MITNKTNINNYQDLFNYVKNIKNKKNFEMDTSQIVDNLIFKWFSQNGINGLDICYKKFNEMLQEKNNFNVRFEEGKIKAEWE